MTKAKSNVMADFGLPIIVLVLICAIMSGLLAFTNGITAPIIEEAERKAAEEARLEVLPNADSFLRVEIADLPGSVTEVYQAENGAGYTFSIVAQGYGGKNTLKMAVGIDMDGKITGTKVLDRRLGLQDHHRRLPGPVPRQGRQPGGCGQHLRRHILLQLFPGRHRRRVCRVRHGDGLRKGGTWI